MNDHDPIERPARTLCLSAALVLLALAAGCSGPADAPTGGPAAELVSIEQGRLVDVYGLRDVGGTIVHAPYRSDVLASAGTAVAAAGKRHGFEAIGTNPATLRSRLLIPHAIDSDEFVRAFAALRSTARRVEAGAVVPHNAAIRLTFDRDLGIGEDWFVERDAAGRVVGLRNADAVQLTTVDGGADGSAEGGAARLVPCRIIVRGTQLILDPVLLEDDARRLAVPASPLGLPTAVGVGAPNIRLTLALEGPARLPRLCAASRAAAPGVDARGRRALCLPFRAASAEDSAARGSGGFVDDVTPPRLLGNLPFFLERVDDIDPQTQRITLYKAGIDHDIDQGDVVSLFVDQSGIPVVVVEIIADPVDDNGLPAVQHVRALVPGTSGLAAIDPRGLPGYPANPQSPSGQAWLVQNAPRASLSAEFTAERRAPNGAPYGDDPRYFVTFSPVPLPLQSGQQGPPNENVSPHAAAILRFSKSLDLSTVRPLDSVFFATRDVLDPAAALGFAQSHNIDPNVFDRDKYRTPHLVHGRLSDLGGSQTTFFLRPPLGFYLDDNVRRADEGVPFAQKRYKYFLHLLAGPDGIKDLAGNELDLGTSISLNTFLAVPFSLDTRKDITGNPLFADNLAISVARRYASRDEDEQPSYYRASEVQPPNTPPNFKAFPLDDLFGAVIYLADGRLLARPTSRVTRVADDINQAPPPPQSSPLRYCPLSISGEAQVATATGSVAFGAGLVDPGNHYGCRLQTVWREIDLSLSRLDPYDLNLDVEQMYWAPFRSGPVQFDTLPRTSLFLGHAEQRPEPCVGAFSALPTLARSGLGTTFTDNYVHNRDTLGNVESAPPPHAAFVDQAWRIDPARVVLEPNGINRFMPLPACQEPYFVWRNELVVEQGGNSGTGADVRNAARTYEPYVIAPFLQGQGRLVTADPNGNLEFNLGFWSNASHFGLTQRTRRDQSTDGALGSIALPLLADLWVLPSGEAINEVDPRLIPPVNGWQISLPVLSSPQPAFRAYSSGGLTGGGAVVVDPSSPSWQRASGGFSPSGNPTAPADNSLYWTMVDFLKRTTVVTAGFVDLFDPHRMPPAPVDPRLGPYLGGALPANMKVTFASDFDPPLGQLPAGTQVAAEFRGAGAVDPAPWRAVEDLYAVKPDAENFPLDPFKAGDAHIRKYDDRPVAGVPRDWWTYPYNKNLTSYTADANDLMDPAFLTRFAGPNETFTPQDVRYVNWRFVMRNDVAANPPRSPSVDSFAMSYRFEPK